MADRAGTSDADDPTGQRLRLGRRAAAVAAGTALLFGAGAGPDAAGALARTPAGTSHRSAAGTADAAGTGARCGAAPDGADGAVSADAATGATGTTGATAATAAAPVPVGHTAAGPAPVLGSRLTDGTGPVTFGIDRQLPIGLWSRAAITLRAPAAHGTVDLDVTTEGFSTISVEFQRYDRPSRRWVDLADVDGNAALPTRGRFSFPVRTRASAAHPDTVALRLQDLDRPGRLTVAASYADGLGRSYRAAVRSAPATRPRTVLSGWTGPVALARGGPAQQLTVTVRNTTDRTYPALGGFFYIYGQGGNAMFTPADLVVEQRQGRHGWRRLTLVPSGCDPGMSVPLEPAGGSPLPPGRTVVFRLRLAVVADAPSAVVTGDAGLAVQNAGQPLLSEDLPFTVRG